MKDGQPNAGANFDDRDNIEDATGRASEMRRGLNK
jgi:hypothetical protein